MRTIEDRKRIKAFFEDKSKQRFRETGSYACEHATDIRNSECSLCLEEDKPKKKVTKKRGLRKILSG